MPKEKAEKKEKQAKKIIDEPDFDLAEEEWDKTKIGVGIVVVLLLLGGIIVAQRILLPQLGILPRQAVQGAETSTVQPTPERISLPSTDDMQRKIGEIQDQVTHLNVQDIASSSPQVQQLLRQIQQLPQMPANAAKAACIQLCNKL